MAYMTTCRSHVRHVVDVFLYRFILLMSNLGLVFSRLIIIVSNEDIKMCIEIKQGVANNIYSS